MGLLSDFKPLMEVRAENGKTGAWRKVVVPEEMLLLNLHRVLQYAVMKQTASDSRISAMDFCFTLRGAKLPRQKTAKLSDAAGKAFLTGRESLSYTADGATLAVTAGKRAMGSMHANGVPRCIKGSQEAELDRANQKLSSNRFGSSTARNTQKRKLPRFYVDKSVTAEELAEGFLAGMRAPVDSGLKLYKRLVKQQKEEAVKKKKK